MDEQNIKRMLTITWVGEVKEVGQKGTKKLPFKGKDAEGHELQYFTFRDTLFPSIVTGKTVEIEFQESHREHEGNTYVDRKVSQIFVDGQPIAKSGFGGKSWGQSPETIELRHKHDLELEAIKRASIEKQTALAEVGLAIRQQNVTIPAGIVPAYWRILEGMLGIAPLPENGPKEDKSFEKTFPAHEGPTTIQELCKMANEQYGLQPSAVAKEAAVESTARIQDVPRVWAMIQAKYPKKQAPLTT